MPPGLAVPAALETGAVSEPVQAPLRKRTRRSDRTRDQARSLSMLDRYVAQRYVLWSRYDLGIQMTWNSFYEVTPEPISLHIASRFRSKLKDSMLIADLFAGVGSNAIALAGSSDDARQTVEPYVIAVECNASKCRMLRHNARIYEVSHRVDVVIADAFTLLPRWQAVFDAVFASPPWGGPNYRRRPTYNLDAMKPYSASEIFELGWHLSPNVAVLLPRSSDERQLARIAEIRSLEIEENWLHGRLKTLTVYSGALAECNSESAPRFDDKMR
ncbi:Trimethylguanosine synthase [Cyanidiococcus yangmingshanensis]|uniref:Trimethylguanosine synthase n=1 Tax=Cyanidiococcus yangmingshanensis TaxID=2690220 RepID=A0A7J7IKY6_9RHOD|nr:Trimethylguanosine synthase [Cyanidiococcus yangmingshanensis]